MNSAKQVECTIPILPVRNIENSLAFYTSVLGFKVDWGGEPGSQICSVSRDRCSIMLSGLEPFIQPAWVWIGVEDESLFAEYRTAGVKVIQEPRNYSWAYEMKFADLDGNVLWLGTEPRSDLPPED